MNKIGSSKYAEQSKNKLPKQNVIGTPITTLPFHEQIDLMLQWAKGNKSKVVCVGNPYSLMESRSNNQLKSFLEQADIVTVEGIAVWGLQALRVPAQTSSASMDIFLNVCRQCVDQNVSIYLLGSTKEVLYKIQQRLSEDFPTLTVTGMESLPFSPLTEKEDAAVVERINRSGAGFVFVSLGCPKQERWMSVHRDRVRSVMIGVGSVFHIYANFTTHTPRLCYDSGLEWLYRLVQEPRRLGRRYLTTIPPFIYLVAQQIILGDQSDLRNTDRITNRIVQALPEEWQAEFVVLKKRIEKERISKLRIRYKIFLAITQLLWAWLQVKVDNLRLPSHKSD